MSCHRCGGCLEGPQFENTTQGRVLTIHCLNCGWRDNDKVLAVSTEQINKVFPKCRPDVVKRVKVWDLSKYEFLPGDESGPPEGGLQNG